MLRRFFRFFFKVVKVLVPDPEIGKFLLFVFILFSQGPFFKAYFLRSRLRIVTTRRCPGTLEPHPLRCPPLLRPPQRPLSPPQHPLSPPQRPPSPPQHPPSPPPPPPMWAPQTSVAPVPAAATTTPPRKTPRNRSPAVLTGTRLLVHPPRQEEADQGPLAATAAVQRPRNSESPPPLWRASTGS
jgi:hypothetical protein